jgi:hypothetical protein
MYEEEIAEIKQIVKKFYDIAPLKKIPQIKVAQLKESARVDFTKLRITISENELKKWQKGISDVEDMEALLAHEYGHLIDLQRGLKSVLVKSTIKQVLYFIAGAGLLIGTTIFSSVSILSLVMVLTFFLWIIIFPYFNGKCAITAQLEADTNASKLIGRERLASAIIRRIRMPPMSMSIIGTWNRLRFILVVPMIGERLKNLNLEVETIQAKFKNIS